LKDPEGNLMIQLIPSLACFITASLKSLARQRDRTGHARGRKCYRQSTTR
jgi:hypothetical protein